MDFITVSQAQGRVPVTIFHVRERINMSNTAELESMANEAYAKGTRHLLLDLTDAPSVTSAGIRSIISLYRLLEQPAAKDPASVSAKAAHLKLLNLSAYVREVLTIAGVLEFLETYDDLEQAVASF